MNDIVKISLVSIAGIVAVFVLYIGFTFATLSLLPTFLNLERQGVEASLQYNYSQNSALTTFMNGIDEIDVDLTKTDDPEIEQALYFQRSGLVKSMVRITANINCEELSQRVFEYVDNTNCK